MKKKLLFLMLSVLTLGAWADTYTPVAYIEYPSNGANDRSRRFDTGYIVKQNTKIVVKFMAYSGDSWRAIFSGRDITAGKGMSLYQSDDNQMEYFVGNWTADRNNINLSTGTGNIHTAVCTYDKLILDGSETASGASSFTASTRSVTLFSNPEWDNSFRGRIYYFSIYEDNKLVHNFVPAKSSNGTKGFYDIVGNTYITTVTSGDDANFTAGPDGNEVCSYWSTGDAILPSIKYGGSYSAYTWVKDSGSDYGAGEAGNTNFNKIQGTPEVSDEKNWYDIDYKMPRSSSIDWQFGSSVLPNNWAPHYGDVYARRYFIVNNTLPSTVYMPTPHDDAPCEYYINGTLIWSRTGTEPSVNGWYEDEVVRLTDAQKALIKTDGTVNVFAFHVHQNWGGKYADGGLYGDARTDNTPSKKFNDDTNRSRLQTVFNTFSVSDFTTWYGISSATAENAKAACNYRQDASYYFDQLFPSALNTRINTAKAIKNLSKNSTSGESALNTAISTAEGAVSAANKDNYVSALTALNTAINAAVIDIKQNQAEKSTQPTIFTMVSESVVGTDDNNYGTIVNDRADGFYVYNVGTGRWFCGGDDWGAHAAVGFPGIKVTTPKNDHGSGHYNSVVTWLCNGNWGTSCQLDHGGYCDTSGNGWKFWKQNAEQGIYTWSRNGDNTGNNSGNDYGRKNLVGFAPSTYARVNTDRTDADDPYNQWIFVTEAQRDAMAADAWATASESNPVDLTYKIKMPGLNQRERKEGTNQDSEELDWTCNHANYLYSDGRKVIMGRNDNHADFVCDIYGVSWNDEFSWTQTVTGLTPGKYRVKVQGYNNGGSDANKACLVANGQKTILRERSSESVLPWTTKLPENTFDNPEYFQVGCYWNSVICTVGSNGELTLGVESPSITGGHVVIFDNFRLEYVGLSGVTVGDANYTTFVAPYNIDTMPEGVEAYACQVNTNSVHLEQVDAIPEGEAVVLKNTGSYTFAPASGDVALGTANDLRASDGTAEGDDENIFALANKANGVGFYLVESGVKIPAGKGYLNLSGAGVKSFYGFEEDDADGISPLLTSPEEEEQIYNLAGQKLSKMQKGVNIVNGRKVLF